MYKKITSFFMSPLLNINKEGGCISHRVLLDLCIGGSNSLLSYGNFNNVSRMFPKLSQIFYQTY